MPTIEQQLREPLTIDKVEFRIGQVFCNKDKSQAWATLLAYKNARVDMDRLDDVLGPFNWQRKHQKIDGVNYCSVGIRRPAEEGECDDPEAWVWKSDAGVESRTEAEKGEASDAFKRACFNIGIGRELYDYPDIFFELNEGEWYYDQNKDKAFASKSLRIKRWTWHAEYTNEDGKHRVASLQGVDDHGVPRFSYPRHGGGARRGSSGTREGGASAPADGAQNASAGATEKPWYNDYDRDVWELQSKINEGATPGDILKELKTRFRVNKKTEAQILAMEPGEDVAF